MIKPTIGRVVLVHRSNSIDRRQPEPALICYVHGDDCINVAGFNANGEPFGATSVYLHDEANPLPSWCTPTDEGHHGTWAEWMPYQKSVAKGETPPVLHEAPVGSGG